MSKKDTSKKNGILFSQEELTGMEPNNLFNQPEGPVTCLGLEFPNNETRREYFREELRKQLPELRRIEGFPIGTDDDIIRLSDPPYYTACPNPWLNDFIKEWEDEKSKLQSEGKRDAHFDVKEPYAADVSEGRSNPIYLAHTYHTKVPHPAIMKYILHYTQPGDIVFDGFAGTGMTGVAAHKCGTMEANPIVSQISHAKKGERHAVCSDLSPIATFIAYNYNSPQNPFSFKQRANRIIKEVEDSIGWMYETKHFDGRIGKINYVIWSDVYVCPNCGKEFSFYDVAVDEDNQKIRNSFKCPHCGSIHTKKSVTNATESYYDDVLCESLIRLKTIPASIKYQTADNKYHKKKPDAADLELIERIEKMPLPFWVPSDEIPVGINTEQPKNAHITHVHHMYTRRNLYIASCIKNAIKDDVLLNVLLTSYLNARGTKMTRYKLEKAGNAILNGTMYIAAVTAEQNLFDGFKGKVDDLFKAYDVEAKNVVNTASATALTLPDCSIDYIFTDPPFGGNIMYSELNLINEAWLKVQTNNTEEAIINKVQNKNLFSYQTLMNAALKEYYRVLKPGKWLTMEFSNTSAAVWNSIQNALQGVGFIVVNVAGLDKQQGSFKSYTSPTAVKQDLIITCYKPTDEFVNKFTSSIGNIDNVWDFVEDVLEHLPVHLKKDNATTAIAERSPKILFDRLITYFVQRGHQVPIDAADFQKGLKDRFVERDGMYFTATQAAEYEEERKNTEGFAPMGIIVSDEANGIEWLKNLLRESPKTYNQIQPEWMQAINGLRKGDILPELKTILKENFIEMEDGRWRLPNIQDDVDKNLIHTKALLREFKLIKEQAMKPKAKIKEVRVEALRAGFKQCYIDKDFATIVLVAERIPHNLLEEDEVLLQFYDIALNKQ